MSSHHISLPWKITWNIRQEDHRRSKTLVENAQALYEISIAHSWSKWNQPVDRSEWHMPANMVNAYYDPQQNQIVFPAAILQAPFYDLHQSSSANYGGIGAVIAHEIHTPLTPMELPLMRMVAWRTGGNQKITKPLPLARKKSSISLKAKTLMVLRLTGNWPSLKT